MPFDTIGRSQKRTKPSSFNQEQELYSPCHLYENTPFFNNNKDWLFNETRKKIHHEFEEEEFTMASSPTTSAESNHHPSSVYSLSLPSPAANFTFWNQPPISIPSSAEVDIWSKFNLSYTDVGINMEANVTSASDLHSLIDAFSKLCSTNSPVVAHDPHLRSASLPPQSPLAMSGDEYHISSSQSISSSGITLCRNKSHKLKPVNYFASVGRLGQLTRPNSKHGQISLKQVADACVDTYFTCWIRNTPILRREDFMTWYESQLDPTNTLIVNAICVCVFRHMVLHHSRPGLEHFIGDQDKIQEQEEYFFDQARECLSQSFDNPDRFTIIALLFLLYRAEPSRRHHYAGMAASALHELEIYPRTVEETDDESYEKEMDTRLWWYVWAWDFYLYSSGAPKNTPQPRIPGSEIDLPRIMEQDIDNDEISVIAYIYCLRLWKIQAHFISTMYEQESDMTLEQLQEYDQQLLAFYAQLPDYLKFESGFEYGHEDLFIACIRVNIEYNATRIILHKLFVPDVTDSRPSQSSLESLNICLKMALKQLPTLNSGSFLPNGRCAFDRDELWRASEVISMAMDIYRACASIEDRAMILKDIRPLEFENGLTKALEILKNTMEFEALSRNWIQVADWLQVEIRRHKLYSNSRTSTSNSDYSTKQHQPDYFLANLKTDAEQKRQAGMIDTDKIKSDLLRRMSVSSSNSSSNKSASSSPPAPASLTLSSSSSTFSLYNNNNRVSSPSSLWIPQRSNHINSFSSFSTSSEMYTPLHGNTSSTSPPLFMDKQRQFQKPMTNNNTMQFVSTFPSTEPTNSFVQYNPQQASSSTKHKTSKNQPKFRYFSPKKMNKYMFIDDNPML
jgi:hypothetical protein